MSTREAWIDAASREGAALCGCASIRSRLYDIIERHFEARLATLPLAEPTQAVDLANLVNLLRSTHRLAAICFENTQGDLQADTANHLDLIKSTIDRIESHVQQPAGISAAAGSISAGATGSADG